MSSILLCLRHVQHLTSIKPLFVRAMLFECARVDEKVDSKAPAQLHQGPTDINMTGTGRGVVG